MSERIAELERIRNLIQTSTSDVSKETRKDFWRLIRQIKREVKPDRAEVAIAAEIRDVLFMLDRGKVYPIAPLLGLEIIGGFLAFLVFLYGMVTPVNWMAITTWTLTEIFAVVIRFLGLFFVVALFYPCGRFIAGKLFSIRLDAWCFDEYKEPTLKIDYVTFLLAPPNRRKWFFFVSGLWTLILSLFTGFVGFILGGDILGFSFSLFLILFYVYVIGTRTTSHGRGEMAHYNREKKIEKSWKMKLA